MDKKEFIWENSGRGYYKDDKGVVWEIRKTPYKEIPVVVMNIDTNTVNEHIDELNQMEIK